MMLSYPIICCRTKIPKVKRKKGDNNSHSSPIKTLGAPPIEDLKAVKPLENSIPPGAHTDMFRLVT